MMGNIFKGIKGCLVFIDDIIIFSETWDEHRQILAEVFRGVRAAVLKVKRDKCKFARESVKFLGHIVSARGTEPDPSKVEAVRDFVTPSTLTEVRAFIGMASYCRRFIKNFADIATPLHDITKGSNGGFSWTPSADKAFNGLNCRCRIFLNRSLSTHMPATPVLVLCCPSEELSTSMLWRMPVEH
jgi:hypothetical protein